MDLPVELGPKMQACSARERRFVWEFLLNGCENATDAARKAGVPDPGRHSAAIRVQAHDLRHRERVREAMQEVARSHFGGMLLPAVLAAEAVVLNAKHPDHAKMVLSVLSAHGLGDRSRVDVNVSGSVQVNHTDAAIEDLRRLKALGVPRDKLLETFGYSGLDRYERMLDEADRRTGRLIEHQEGEVKDA